MGLTFVHEVACNIVVDLANRFDGIHCLCVLFVSNWLALGEGCPRRACVGVCACVCVCVCVRRCVPRHLPMYGTSKDVPQYGRFWQLSFYM